jgi:hypothetical protein
MMLWLPATLLVATAAVFTVGCIFSIVRHRRCGRRRRRSRSQSGGVKVPYYY